MTQLQRAVARSWKTSAIGVFLAVNSLMGCLAAVLDNDPATQPDFNTAFVVIMAAIGMILAKDADQTGPAK